MHNASDKSIYLIGSLRNPEIPGIADQIQNLVGVSVFADWFAAGPEADDYWKRYEEARGWSYQDALRRPAAKNVFEFDKRHLEAASAVVLALPAGKSGHMELGWCLGKGKPGFILLDNPDRWDVMYQFANGVTDDIEQLCDMLNGELKC